MFPFLAKEAHNLFGPILRLWVLQKQ